MIGMTAVLGWMALAVPDGSGGVGNLLFPLIMIVLTLATVALTVYRPDRLVRRRDAVRRGRAGRPRGSCSRFTADRAGQGGRVDRPRARSS